MSELIISEFCKISDSELKLELEFSSRAENNVVFEKIL
jgi:hypothetical protein